MEIGTKIIITEDVLDNIKAYYKENECNKRFIISNDERDLPTLELMNLSEEGYKSLNLVGRMVMESLFNYADKDGLLPKLKTVELTALLEDDKEAW